MPIGKLTHFLEAEEVGVGVPESLGQEGQSKLEEVLECRLLGETPNVISEARKGVWHLLSIIKGLVVIYLDRLVRKIAVAAKIIIFVAVFLSLCIFWGLGKGSDTLCSAFRAATGCFYTETTGYCLIIA